MSENESKSKCNITKAEFCPAEVLFPGQTDDITKFLRYYAVSVDILITLSELEHRYLQRVLSLVGGNKSRAARVLGLDRRTLYRMLDRERGEQGGRESSVQLGERHEHHH